MKRQWAIGGWRIWKTQRGVPRGMSHAGLKSLEFKWHLVSWVMFETLRAEVCKRVNDKIYFGALQGWRSWKIPKGFTGHEPDRVEVMSFLMTCPSKTDVWAIEGWKYLGETCLTWKHWAIHGWNEQLSLSLCHISSFFSFSFPLSSFQALATAALLSNRMGVQVVEHPSPIACAWHPHTSCSAPGWGDSPMQACCRSPCPTSKDMFTCRYCYSTVAS